jgi:sec-independent protein translocase protein TatB
MLPDIGGSELLIIAAVALIVVGPKDLPILMRKIGQFIGKMRGMANEFRASFDEMARQSELDELRKEVAAMRSGQYVQPFKDAADEARDVGLDDTFSQIDASLSSGAINPYPGAAAPLSPQPATVEIVEAPKPRKPRAAKALAAPEAPVATKAKAAKVVAAPAKASKTVSKRAPAKKGSDLSAPAPTARRAPVKKSDILS